MPELFSIASRISDPLALSGFLAAAFFLVVRQIIAKNVFPVFTKQISATFLKLVIDRLFILSLVAMVLGFAGFTLTAVLNARTINPEKERAVVSPDDEQARQRIAERRHDLYIEVLTEIQKLETNYGHRWTEARQAHFKLRELQATVHQELNDPTLEQDIGEAIQASWGVGDKDSDLHPSDAVVHEQSLKLQDILTKVQAISPRYPTPQL